MKIYKTSIVNKSETSVSISKSLDGGAYEYKIEHKKTVPIENTDPANYLSPYEKIIVTGTQKTVRLKGIKRAGWKDPFKDSPTRIEMCNFGGRAFCEIIFVQSGEVYHLHKGLVVVCEVLQGTWLEKYQKLTIAEPFIRKIPSKRYPGEIDVQEIQNMQYELRSEKEIENIRKRREEEKNKIRV